jgi:hypothetical protein
MGYGKKRKRGFVFHGGGWTFLLHVVCRVVNRSQVPHITSVEGEICRPGELCIEFFFWFARRGGWKLAAAVFLFALRNFLAHRWNLNR